MGYTDQYLNENLFNAEVPEFTENVPLAGREVFDLETFKVGTVKGAWVLFGKVECYEIQFTGYTLLSRNRSDFIEVYKTIS